MTGGNFPAGAGVLILLSGYPGAGKTTFARTLATRLACVHIESDEVRRRVTGQPQYTRQEHSRTFALAEALVAEALAAGRDVVFDGTNLTHRDRRRFLQLGARQGAAVVPVRLTAPDATIRERLAGARQGYSQATIAVFESMAGRAQPFFIPVVVVDTRFDTASAVALVAEMVSGQRC
ncbi:MAG: AAA family ATPase [Tepidiformaceae bacterium]